MKLLFYAKLQVTWHLLRIFLLEIYEVFRTGFTRTTRECRLLQLVVAGKCFDQKIFLKKYLIRIQWHMLPRIKCITEVWRPFTMFILVCTWFVRFTSLRDFFIWENVYVMSIVSITHAVDFSNQEVLRRRAARGSSSERETMRRKNCKLNFFSMYFVRNNEEIHLSFKNSGHKF